MRRHPLHSSMIASAGFDKKTSLLEIEFNSGAVWHYHHVPEQFFAGLLKAKSAGKFFNEYIQGEFNEERIK